MRLPITLGLLSSANIGLAFLFQWYVLTRLGSGEQTDALFAGLTIPQLVLVVVSDSLMHVLVPLLAGETPEQVRRDTWTFLWLVGGVFALLALLLGATASWWVPLTVPGFSPSGKALTVLLARVQLLGMVLTAVNAVQWAAYHARRQFVWAESAPLLANAGALAVLAWALPRYGVVSAAWIATLRLGLQTLLLAPATGAPVRVDLSSSAAREAWSRIRPLLLGTAYYKTDPVVDRFFLSSTASGSLTLYHFAQQIYGAVMLVFNRALVAPLVPVLACLHKAGDAASLRRAYRRKTLEVGALGAACVLLLGLVGEPALRLLIGHGSITGANVRTLWLIMVWLAGMFVGGVLGQVSATTFYALGDTRTPTRLGVVSYTLYLPAKIALFFAWGIQGLALAASLQLVVNFVVQDRLLARRLPAAGPAALS